jgi:type II secretory pathway component PulM
MVLPIWAGRVAAFLLLLAVIAVAYLFIVPPLLANYGESKAAIDDARGLLGRYQRIAATQPELEAATPTRWRRPSCRTASRASSRPMGAICAASRPWPAKPMAISSG